jgi:hypothetical protein
METIVDLFTSIIAEFPKNPIRTIVILAMIGWPVFYALYVFHENVLPRYRDNDNWKGTLSEDMQYWFDIALTIIFGFIMLLILAFFVIHVYLDN